MLSPGAPGQIVNARVPVPPAATKGVDESARPNVVVIFEPPESVNTPLTVMVNEYVEVEPAASVATIVS